MGFKQICYPPVFIIKDSVKTFVETAYILDVILMMFLFFNTPSYYRLMYILLAVGRP